MYKHILIPTDGSPLTRKAAVNGVKLAKALGARVTGLFAAPPATPLGYGKIGSGKFMTQPQHAALIKKTAGQYLDIIKDEAAKAGVPFEGVTITNDFPADAIIAVAAKRKCDLVFMASHGRRGLAGVLLGSETQKVLVNSKIPVLFSR